MSDEMKKGGSGTLIKIAFRNIGRNRRRTVFCISAVGIAVFFVVFYGGFIGGMTQSINELVQIFELGHVRVVTEEYEAEQEFMPVMYPVADGRSWRELAADIERIPGVKAVMPRINTLATLQDSTLRHATLWGLDIARETEINNFNMTDRNDGLIQGRWPTPGSNEAAIGLALSEKTGFVIGDRITLRTTSAQFADRFWSPEVVGIFLFDYIRFDERYIIVDIERLQRLLTLDEGTQQLVIFAEDEKQSPFITASVQNMLGPGNLVTDWEDHYWVAIMRQIVPLYTLMFIVFLSVASFLIVNTVVMIIHERIKEIGMMGCLGMTRGEIVKVFFFESIFLSIFGATAGVLVGGTLVGLLSNFPVRIGDLYGNTFADMPLANAIFTQFSVTSLVQAFLMGIVIAAVFTLIPSLRSVRVEPVEALRR
ncbi:MAG: ABC transporter permease [Treponema sp.]|nr:ABC transporter permease [Treponema sp.]